MFSSADNDILNDQNTQWPKSMVSVNLGTVLVCNCIFIVLQDERYITSDKLLS